MNNVKQNKHLRLIFIFSIVRQYHIRVSGVVVNKRKTERKNGKRNRENKEEKLRTFDNFNSVPIMLF